MQRHGSRLPLVAELQAIIDVGFTLSNRSVALQKAKLPSNLEFLRTYQTTLSHDDLTAAGRQELFDHGVL